MTVFAELTDGRGETPITLRLVDVDEENELFRAEAKIDMSDPLAIGMLIITINGAVFPSPGEYRLQLYCGDEHLLERRLALIDLSKE